MNNKLKSNNKIRLLLGSNNKHKAQEFYQILNSKFPDKIELLIPNDILDNYEDVDETGSTLEENSKIKAEYFYDLTKISSFADDTGLEIEALNNLPGVNSARFSGVHGNDSANRKKVLELMKNIPIELRTARFRTVICFYDGISFLYSEGICTGKIILEERGAAGFGYDCLFVPDGYNQTFAEMDSDLKNRISHRSKAASEFIKIIENRLK